MCIAVKNQTIEHHYDNKKYYIITSIDHASKFGYARTYKTKSSASASDFLYRLPYLVQDEISNMVTDNGCEFAYYFNNALNDLNINSYFTRVKTPEDNPEAERFNQTLQYKWLIEYNFIRPHMPLDYLTPIEYIEKHTGKKEKPIDFSPKISNLLLAPEIDQLTGNVLPMYLKNTEA